LVALVQPWLVVVVCDCIIAPPVVGPDMEPPVWASAAMLKALHAITAAASLRMFMALS
jgi:hypothetical protein